MDPITIIKEILLATAVFAIGAGPFIYILLTIPTRKKDKERRH